MELDSIHVDAINNSDPRVFTSISLSETPCATSPNPRSVQAHALIDCGSTHVVLGKKFAERTGLPMSKLSTTGEVYGFDGAPRVVAHETDLFVDDDSQKTKFLVTSIKDSYDAILGMPWLRKNGHRIDWKKSTLKPNDLPSHIAAMEASSNPPTSPDRLEAQVGNTRDSDEGALYNTETKPAM